MVGKSMAAAAKLRWYQRLRRNWSPFQKIHAAVALDSIRQIDFDLIKLDLVGGNPTRIKDPAATSS
jgi:hypothetical protein